MPCHGFGENVKPGADALKQTLKAITYVICMMQHNASALTWYAVHQQVSPKRPHVTISPFYVRRVYYQGVIWNRCMESVIDARGGVIYATGSLLVERCLWNPKIRPTQVPAHTQNKDPYQESRCQCFVYCLCTHIGIHLDITLS